MKVYLAGPIAGMSDRRATDWRTMAERALHEAKIETLNPMTARDFRGVDAITSMQVVEPDKADIDAADVVLANAHIVSVGTSMEVLYAWEHGKWVVTIVPNRERCSPWIMYHSDVVVEALSTALDMVVEYATLVDAGKAKLRHRPSRASAI